MIALYSLVFLLPNGWWEASGPMHEIQNHLSKAVIGYVQDGDDTPDVADQVDYPKITHLNIAFANPTDTNGTMSVPPHIKPLVERAHKNKVKVLISIGGGFASTDATQRERYFDLMSDAKRSSFVRSLVKYVDDNRLDGLDVDLEGPAIDKGYASLVADLAKALKSDSKLLTAAVSRWFGGDQITSKALGSFDYVNVMAYDATGPWDPKHPGQHSSLDYAKGCIEYWIGRGVPKTKLVLGVPFYGWGFGDAFNQGGYTFAQIVEKFPGSESSDQAGSTVWYNGIPTIQAKSKYVLEQGLGGVMIWSLNQDARGNLSLLSAIHDAIHFK